MDVSLDEIIKRNKLNNRRKKRPGPVQNDKKEAAPPGKKSAIAKRVGGPALRGAATLKSAGVKKKKVTDLRLLIGGKPAARAAGPVVRDAREKLGKVARVPDAREKLMSRATAMNAEMVMRRARRNSGGPRRKLDNRKPAYMDLEEARIKGRSGGSSLLYRTVDNEVNYLRDFRSKPLPMARLLHPLATVNRPAPTPLMPDSWLQPSVQDITRFQPLTRTFNSQDDVWAPPQIPRRSTNGVSAKRRLDREEEVAHTQGYRIVVSNLQPSVTHEDIKELFEDIGSLYSSRVVRPGTAEVVYKNMEDAVKAVDTYHNRQLDGQPMKCLLVKPSNMSRILSKGSVVPDLHAIHKALFNK